MHALRSGAPHLAARQRGLSLVEMMVGLTVGLFIAGAALLAAVNATGENRRLLLEARLLQDLRATMDLVTRSLRRAGYWGNAQAGVRDAADASAQTGYEATGYAVVTPAAGSASAVQFRVAGDADDSADDDETLGFRQAAGADGIGRVQVLLAGAASYQDLTDPAVTDVTEFTVEALHPIVTEAVDLALGHIDGPPTNIDVRQIVDHSLKIDANRSRLLQALINIVVNAVEACADSARGGVLTITAAVEADTHARITIADNGCGMGEEALRDCVLLYSSGKPGGMGFGLPLAKKIIESDHHGTLSIESRKGEGTVVTIILPVDQATCAE